MTNKNLSCPSSPVGFGVGGGDGRRQFSQRRLLGALTWAKFRELSLLPYACPPNRFFLFRVWLPRSRL